MEGLLLWDKGGCVRAQQDMPGNKPLRDYGRDWNGVGDKKLLWLFW